MKKAVAFLLCVLIFVTPVTTLVKADVVIGDNDNTIINENATILGRKLALMESLSDLALSGVTEFSISNTNDVDSYLDSLWNELNSAIDSLSDGTGFTEISNELKSKYFTNLVKYKDYIDNRGSYLANLLPSGSPTTTLLSTFFADNVYGKQYTEHYDLALDMFKALSRYNANDNILPDFGFIRNINTFLLTNNNVAYNFFDYSVATNYPWGHTMTVTPNNFSYFAWGTEQDSNFIQAHNQGVDNIKIVSYTPLMDINVNTSNPNQVIVTYSNASNGQVFFGEGSGYYNIWVSDGNLVQQNYGNQAVNLTTVFSGLSTALNYLYSHFCNINLYVDDVLWVSANQPITSNPTIDIDGLLKIFGSNDPVQYQLKPNTKIDYNQLYQVIYNAIRDNLPISKDDITYYDSHDTIYSPTIINNYGEDEGNESDLIDTILDYAVIPKFDTAIAQPMRLALTNGVVIMNNSITNVIPQDILLILGACFFLLLFAVVINRMIK